MALKDMITKWHAAMCFLDDGRLREAEMKLLEIQKPSARILHNVGCVNMLQQRFVDAIQYFNTSIRQDEYLAIAFYQRAICYHEVQSSLTTERVECVYKKSPSKELEQMFQNLETVEQQVTDLDLNVERSHEAKSDFLKALSLVQDNGIDYKKLGAEVKLTPELLAHCIAVSDESSKFKKIIKLQTLPVTSCVFRPPKGMVDNLTKQDFLGSAKVISSTSEKDIISASNKQEARHSAAHVRSKASLSLPSSPALPRHVDSKKVFYPPHPNRPPPRLPADFVVNQRLFQKSKSLEDVTALDDMCDIIDIDEVNDFNTEIPKPVPFHILKSEHFLSNPSSFVTSVSDQPHVVSETFKKVSPNRSENENMVIQLFLETRINNLKEPENSRAKSISEQISISDVQPSSRPASNHIYPESSVHEGENINASQIPVTGHANRIRQLFEKKDSSQPLAETAQFTGQRQRLVSVEKSRAAVTQHRLQATPVSSPSVQKSPKPSRPPPPKFSK